MKFTTMAILGLLQLHREGSFIFNIITPTIQQIIFKHYLEQKVPVNEPPDVTNILHST